jgi:hypothetical protein
MPSDAITTLIATVITPVVVGVVAVLTPAGLPTRFAPLAALVLGILAGLGLFLSARIDDLFIAIVVGAGIGLAAVGSHAGVRSVFGLYDSPDRAPSTPPPAA